MTTCPRCNGEKTIPILTLIRGHWLPTAYDSCPDCNGTGNQIESTCRYCGMPLRDKIGPYCSDVCEFRAGQKVTLNNKRFQIKAVVAPPDGGWVYGENVTIKRGAYIIDVRIGLGGCVMSRIRKAGTSIESGLITVEKR